MRKGLIILAALLLLGTGDTQAQEVATKNWQYEFSVIAGPSDEPGDRVAAYFGGALSRKLADRLWASVTGQSYTERGGIAGFVDIGDTELGKDWTLGMDVGYTLDVNGEPSFNTGWLWVRFRVDRLKDNNTQVALTVKQYDEPGVPIDFTKNTFLGVGIVHDFGALPGLGD